MGGTTEAIRLAGLLSGCEAVFGTAITMASLVDMFVLNSFDPAAITAAYRTDANKINGTRGMTQRQRETAEGALNIPVDASVELLSYALAMPFGNEIVTGAGDPYSHAIKHPAVCTLAPKSTTWLQGIICAGLTAGYKSFKGCSINQITLTMAGQSAIQMAIAWKTDGSETTQAAAVFPTTFLVPSYLLGSMTVLKVGPHGAAVDISSQLQSLKITWDFGLTRLKRASSNVFVPGWRFSKGKPTIKIEFVIAADKSDAVYGYFTGDTLLTAQVAFTFSGTRSVTIDIDSCYLTAKENADDIEPTLDCVIEEIDVIANQGPAIYTCKNAVPAYLVGA